MYDCDLRELLLVVLLEMVFEYLVGFVCLSGCVDYGVEDEVMLCCLCEVFGSERLCIELQCLF